jgi:glutamyl-tRNA synthetase
VRTSSASRPAGGEVLVDDLVQGQSGAVQSDLDDLVLLRSDGAPTYNLAVVVDDHDMGVTHVIRGDDHLNNAARQSLIYEALGWEKPAFAHIPLIHGPDGAKLSKRHGAQAVGEFAEQGYLPEAMRNYLARLGWGHGDEEIFDDAASHRPGFDIADVVVRRRGWTGTSSPHQQPLAASGRR